MVTADLISRLRWLEKSGLRSQIAPHHALRDGSVLGLAMNNGPSIPMKSDRSVSFTEESAPWIPLFCFAMFLSSPTSDQFAAVTTVRLPISYRRVAVSQAQLTQSDRILSPMADPRLPLGCWCPI